MNKRPLLPSKVIATTPTSCPFCNNSSFKEFDCSQNDQFSSVLTKTCECGCLCFSIDSREPNILQTLIVKLTKYKVSIDYCSAMSGTKIYSLEKNNRNALSSVKTLTDMIVPDFSNLAQLEKKINEYFN